MINMHRRTLIKTVATREPMLAKYCDDIGAEPDDGERVKRQSFAEG